MSLTDVDIAILIKIWQITLAPTKETQNKDTSTDKNEE